ncbi:hypothetical protein K437DRAFT_225743 [Tilletiaria anomala UBC 951]|uniref:tripeptidyl-peptidase II n=1 Tax=Tilletiaria anomala (strain ATCC 24038 / CBS 436.72 / UBC 951) TaxID=1037660 RepID=A0A066VP03_TILAU|nr:uncharacterized protein K437DRAFT_225743 [Tilletiaria anomala UBC 951]KDN43196.1 hypothetical protein K437DRAFT_225743 [Tilletiaria anomala UBC 951]
MPSSRLGSLSGASVPVPAAPFPISGLLPKETTQALQFLRKYPSYDGRNVRVAILDTGVDVAAAGLDGKAKVVDAIDCTGAGDVLLSDVTASFVAGTPSSSSSSGSSPSTLVSPLTSRKLYLSPTLQNPSGRWYAGGKRAFDFWPSELATRLGKERRKAFEVEHARLVAQAQKELAALEKSKGAAASPSASPSVKAEAAAKQGAQGTESATTSSTPPSPHSQQKAELRSRLAVLDELLSSYSDVGPLLECVVYHDGTYWRAIIGGGEGDAHDPSSGLPAYRMDADLAHGPAVDLTAFKKGMADFRLEREWRFFGEMDRLSYSVNILTDRPAYTSEAAAGAEKAAEEIPTTLSIVAVSGSHGTHVAGIVGAYHAPASGSGEGLSDEDVARNGVAPACEIVSLKIGDARIGTMEQGHALLRAARALIDTQCDLANLSYGEDGSFGVENRGAFAAALREHVIRERDIIFVASAGNNGPALTTVGHPGGTTTGVLSVGAYVNAGAMAQAEYAPIENAPDNVTTWSSRGPASDGDKGVSIYAPGAAITSIPQYCLQATAMYNGTSMSSPNACGSLALLLSALKQNKMPYTPARVIKAVREAGKSVDDPLDVPFIQVDKAWEYLQEYAAHPAADAEVRVAITPPGKPLGRVNTDKRGCYLRERHECSRVNQFQATVKPTFKTHETERSWALQLRCALVATQSWIKAPQFVLLGANGRTFEIRVDAASLPPGLHHGWVYGYDSEVQGYKLFEIPITVAKPEVCDGATVRYDGLRLSAGQVTRRFLHVPDGATWATVRVVTANHAASGTNARLWMHLVQLEPHQRLHSVEKAWVFSLAEGEPVTKRITVKGGMTMEIATAQYFMASSAFEFDLQFEFHGVQISAIATGRDEMTLIGGEGIARLECMAALRPEEFKPSVSFDTRRTFLRPTAADVRPLNTPRDLQPSGKSLFELVTTYALKLSEASNKISTRLPTSGNVYDAAVPMLMQIFDANKKVRQFCDVYPKEVTLPKGDYTIKVAFVHEDAAVLQKLRSATLTVDQKLSKAGDVKLDLYENHVDVFDTSAPMDFKGGIKLMPGERKMLVMDTNLEGDRMPKEAQPGDILIGSFSFAEAKTQLRYIVPPAPRKEKEDDDGSSSGKDGEPTVDLLVSVSKKIKDEEKSQFLDKLVAEHPDHLGLLRARLEAVAGKDESDRKENANAIIGAADAILARVDQTALRLHLGTKQLPSNEQSEQDKKTAKEMDKRKSAVTLALNRKARALLARDGEQQQQAITAFDEMFSEYRKYYAADSNDKEFSNLFVRWSIQQGRYGTALQSVRKAIKDMGAGTSDNLEELNKARALERELLGPTRLGWSAWAANAARWAIVDQPKDYAPF